MTRLTFNLSIIEGYGMKCLIRRYQAEFWLNISWLEMSIEWTNDCPVINYSQN